MSFVLQPWQLMLAVLAAWINQQQQVVIEYLRAENRVLKEKLGKKRILLNDDQRRRLAVKGKVLGRKRLQEVGALFTPDTIPRWHRQFVAEKWDYSHRRHAKPGRPRIRQEIVDLILRLAKENPTWGYDRFQGALANVGYRISDTTVGNVLRKHGLQPAPDRRRSLSWGTFLKAHWDVLAAIDFTTVEVWTKGGLTTFYLLFVMELKTRRVCFAGCTVNPHEAWMKQTARELTNFEDGFLHGKRRLIMDRDAKFCQSFRALLRREGIVTKQLPARSPNLNAYLERFVVGSIKSECYQRMIFFGEHALSRATHAYLAPYHRERNHQGLENRRIEPEEKAASTVSVIQRRQRLGGLLNYYHRDAA